jgi:hypothetical protein
MPLHGEKRKAYERDYRKAGRLAAKKNPHPFRDCLRCNALTQLPGLCERCRLLCEAVRRRVYAAPAEEGDDAYAAAELRGKGVRE